MGVAFGGRPLGQYFMGKGVGQRAARKPKKKNNKTQEHQKPTQRACGLLDGASRLDWAEGGYNQRRGDTRDRKAPKPRHNVYPEGLPHPVGIARRPSANTLRKPLSTYRIECVEGASDVMSLLDVFVSNGVNALFDKRARFLRTRSRNDRRELGVYSEREYLLFVGIVILEAPIT